MEDKKRKNLGLVFEEDLNIKHLNKKPKTKLNKVIRNKKDNEKTSINDKQTIIINKSKKRHKNKVIFKWLGINLNDLVFVLILLSGFFFGLYYLKNYLELSVFDICIIEMISLVFAYLSNLVSQRYLFLLIPLISKFSLYRGYSAFFKGFSYDLNLLFYHYKRLNIKLIFFGFLILLYFFKRNYFMISLIILIIAIILDYFLKKEFNEDYKKKIIKIHPFQSLINGLIAVSPLVLFKFLDKYNNFIFVFLIFSFLFYFFKFENQRINFLILSLALLLFYLGFNNIYLIIVYLFSYSNLMFVAFNNSLSIKKIRLNLEAQLFIFGALLSMLIFLFFKKYLLLITFFVVFYNLISLRFILFKHKNEKKAQKR